MKKTFVSLLLGLFSIISLNAIPRLAMDKILDQYKSIDGITYTLYQEKDRDLYITVESINEKDKLKVDAETVPHSQYIMKELDKELKSYGNDPIKKFIKDYKKWGEWDKDDESKITYFELDDELFEDYFYTEDYLAY